MLSPTDLIFKTLKKRNDLHLSRKLWHVLTVGMMASTYAFLPLRYSMACLAFACLLFIPMDFLRLKNPNLNQFVLKWFGPLMRQNEFNKLAGTTYLLIGVGLIALIFPRDIVLLTLLFLAFADPTASYFGIRYGKDKILGEKSLQGSLAAFFVCSMLTCGYLVYHNLMLEKLLLISLLGGVTGALSELVPVGKMDDNFSLPIISATSLWFLFYLFGAFA